MNTTEPKIPIHHMLMSVRLSCSYSFGRVTDKSLTNTVNSENNTQALVVKKELLPGNSGKKLKELQAILAKFYQYHIKVTLSSQNDGERLLPILFYLDYMNEYAVHQAKVNDAFKEFKNDYQRACVEAAQQLNGAYKASDYPDVSSLHQLLNFRACPVPLTKMDPVFESLGETVAANVELYTQDAIKASIADLNGRMQEALERMVRQLSDPKKKIYDSLTENLAELIGLAPSLNVTEDEKTNTLIKDIREKLLRVGPEDLRNNPEVRKDTAAAADEILRRMR